MRGRVAAAVVATAVLAGCSGGEGGAGPATGLPESSAAVAAPTPSPSSPIPAPPSPAPAAGVPDPLSAVDWATDLTTPWGLDFFGDGSALVSERDTGRVLRIPDGGRPVELGTVEAVASAEGGLLGVTLDPEERWVYAYHSTGSDNRVVRFPLEDGGLGAGEVLLTGIPMARIHDGGQLAFGPDGMLYVSTGDAGNRPDAQDPDSLAGKILRLTPEGAPAPGNPFGNAVFSLGHRNVQGLAFDDAGRLWASELGDSTWDELNLIEAGGNYGWPVVEGAGGGRAYIDPVHTWPTDVASPSGLAHWRGSLWMAGLRGQVLWQVPVGSGPEGAAGEPVAHWRGEHGRLRAVGTPGDAGPLVVGTSNTDGRGRPVGDDDRLLRVG